MSDTALYKLVYQNILDSIKSGEYPENSHLPAERWLCDKYHVSRSTIRQALNMLKEEGYIFTLSLIHI